MLVLKHPGHRLWRGNQQRIGDWIVAKTMLLDTATITPLRQRLGERVGVLLCHETLRIAEREVFQRRFSVVSTQRTPSWSQASFPINRLSIGCNCTLRRGISRQTGRGGVNVVFRFKCTTAVVDVFGCIAYICCILYDTMMQLATHF